MPTLTDTQSLLLATAAQREDGSLLPLPASITAPASGIATSLAALLKKGLAEERETRDASAVRRTDSDLRYGVFVTAAGLAAIGITEENGTKAGDLSTALDPVLAASPAPRVTKAGSVLILLQRASGATLPELVSATGWLPHTTRAALTGLRRQGHEIERFKRDDVTCYRVAGAE